MIYSCKSCAISYWVGKFSCCTGLPILHITECFVSLTPTYLMILGWPPETAVIKTWLRMLTSPLAGPCKKIMPSLGRHMRMCLLPVFREGTLLEWWQTLQMPEDFCHNVAFKWPAAAAAAKSLQSCPTPCDPIDGSPPGSSVPGILQARTLEWVAISFSNAWKWKVKGKSLSRVWLSATPWTAAHQAPPSMGFSRQEYWSGVPLPSPL